MGGYAEIKANGLGMSDMEVSVGLGREARRNTSLESIGSKVFINNFSYEVRRG
jgi:hypothetical protein